MAQLDVRHTVVFADGDGGGNPCPVVLDADGLTTAQMQEAAAAFGHESAFVLTPDDASAADVRLRYFVPRHEMEMCVHATVAATVLLGRAGALPPEREARVQTPLGVRRVWWDGDALHAEVEQFAPRFGPEVDVLDEVLAALGSPAEHLDRAVGPVRSVSTARPKLMVPLVDEAALDGLRPDGDRVAAVCDALDVTGLYPFAVRARGVDAAARQFPARAGYLEDPATGVAACGLASYLARHADAGPGHREGWRRWTIGQGRAMGRPSLLSAEARVGPDGAIAETRVGGHMAPPTHSG